MATSTQTPDPSGRAPAGTSPGDRPDTAVLDPRAATPTVADTAVVDVAEAREVARLRAEVEELRRRNDELRSPAGVRARRFGRSLAVVVLMVVGALCLTLAAPAIWARNQVLDTPRYVATVSPLASDPAVQDSVSRAIKAQIAARFDVKAVVADALPPRAEPLQAPITGALTGLVNTVVDRFVASPAFEKLWVQANTLAHEQLVGILTGQNTGLQAVQIKNEVVLLDLAPVVEGVKARLVEAGLGVASKIPAVGTTIEIGRLQGLDRAQTAVRRLNTLATWLPWLGLLAFAGAVAAARRRRRAVVVAALATAGGMLLVRLALLPLRDAYLSQIPPSALSQPAAANVFDTVTRYLRDGLRIVFVVALLIALVFVLLGHLPSRQAWGRVGGAVSRTTRRIGTQSAFGAAVRRNPRVWQGGVAAAGALVLVLWSNPGWGVLLGVLIVVALLVVALELIRRAEPVPAPVPRTVTVPAQR